MRDLYSPRESAACRRWPRLTSWRYTALFSVNLLEFRSILFITYAFLAAILVVGSAASAAFAASVVSILHALRAETC
jgi:hypothetical protein